MVDQMIDGFKVAGDISPKDGMFTSGCERHYFGVGQSALDCIRCSLASAQVPTDNVKRILDLPCGHGRVLRYLRAAFPEAEIIACDLLRDGVDYCAQSFGATPVYSSEDPMKIPLGEGSFDLVWVGSLLTHLDSSRWTAFLEFFRRVLRPGGVVVFTTHGRFVCDQIVRGEARHYGLPYWRATGVRHGYEQSGFGYANYLDSNSYGISISSPGWVFQQIDKIEELRVAHFSERAWHYHQDVFACVRDPQWRMGHPRLSAWTLLKLWLTRFAKIRERLSDAQ